MIKTENSKSMKETLQLDDSIQKEKQMINESFGLDLSNLNNLTSLNDNSINEFQKLDIIHDENKAYSSKKSESKLDLNDRGIIKETRTELQS